MSGEQNALLAASLWAVGSVLLAVGARRLHVVPLNLIRCVIATVFFWALLPFFGGFRALATIPHSTWLWLTVSVLGLLVVGDTLYFRSMELAGVSWAMPVASISPLWAVLLAALFVDEPLSWSLLTGSVLVVIGVVLISKPTGSTAERNPTDRKARQVGLLLALGVSILWALGDVSLKPGTAGMHSVVANSIRQPMAALLLLGLTLARGRWADLRGLDRRSWAVIAAASLLGSALGTLFFVRAIQGAGAGRTAVLLAVSPIMAIPLSVLWLQERPTLWTLFGTLLATVGIALVI